MRKSRIIIISAINALLLILIGLCLWRANSYSSQLISQQTAEFWAGESKERFAQVSCYFPIGAAIDENAVMAFRKTIDKKLIDAGMEPKTEGTYWSDAYSAVSSVKVQSDRGSFDTTAVGVGGNFFLFHPYLLRSGSYIYDSDVMKDRVVLDYELAWKLFGGTQLDGMTVKINDKPYYVAGVIERETDKFSKKAFNGDPMIFMPYSTLSELKEGTSISSYELTMPDPISKFARTVTTEGFSASKAVVVENSARYSFLNIYNIFKNFGSRSIVNNAVVYPYWENAARVSEIFIARLYVIISLLAVIPVICLVIISVKLIKYLIAKLKILGFKLWDAWDDRYARRDARRERKALKLEKREPNLSATNTVEQIDEEGRSKERVIQTKVLYAKQNLMNFIKSVQKKVKINFKEKGKATQRNKNKQLKSISKEKEQNNDVFDEKEIAMDIESIVREILYESSGSEVDAKK